MLSPQGTVYPVRLACSSEADAGRVTQRRLPTDTSTTRHTISLIYMICLLTAEFVSQERLRETSSARPPWILLFVQQAPSPMAGSFGIAPSARSFDARAAFVSDVERSYELQPVRLLSVNTSCVSQCYYVQAPRNCL